MSMKLSEHFILEEFNCHDGTPYPSQWIDSRLRPLIIDLEIIRSYVDKPIIITSGYRSPSYNKKVGGALFSQHTTGRAVDFKCLGLDAKSLHAAIMRLIYAKKIIFGGVGLYPTWVHYDHGPARTW